MTATVKRLEPTRVELEIAVPDDELESARERAFRTLVRGVRVPGFRPGKAPRRLFEQQFGREGIEERALSELVPVIYRKVMHEQDLHPLEMPQFTLLPRNNGEPIRFQVIVDVRPEITLADLSTLTIDTPAPQATDDALELALRGLQEQGALFVPVQRPAQLGDTLIADYVGRIDGEAFEGGSANEQAVVLREERFIPGFVQGLIGVAAGEERTVTAEFPADYPQAALAGKTALFEIKVHEVKEPELPELNDDFAARYLPAPATLDDLRAQLRTRITRTLRAEFKNEQAEAFVDRLLALHDFALPPKHIERELDLTIQEKRLEVLRTGEQTWEQYLESEGKDEAQLRADWRSSAEKHVKTLLLIEEVARREGIQATNAEIEYEVQQLARQYGKTPQEIREGIGDHLHSLIDGIVRSKTLDLMLERAITPAEE